MGGVVINLDPSKSYAALAKLGDVNLDKFMNEHLQHSFFIDYEKGLISSRAFRKNICDIFEKTIADEAIDLAWNEMLLDIPKVRFETIAGLKGKYKLFVLSNTNQIHVNAFEKTIEAHFGLNNYYQLFDHVYYSNEINKRKPDGEIYQQVLSDQKLEPHETLFFEDNKNNIDAAAALGIQTHWVSSNELNLDFIRNELY